MSKPKFKIGDIVIYNWNGGQDTYTTYTIGQIISITYYPENKAFVYRTQEGFYREAEIKIYNYEL